jgi:hypothetical protein
VERCFENASDGSIREASLFTFMREIVGKSGLDLSPPDCAVVAVLNPFERAAHDGCSWLGFYGRQLPEGNTKAVLWLKGDPPAWEAATERRREPS